MTDRELLELAAKAAGSDVFMLGGTWVKRIGKEVAGLERWVGRWNPLEDDGDALRLAVACCLDISIEDYQTIVRHLGVYEAHEGDPYAATRRAITRAAAEIGKAKP